MKTIILVLLVLILAVGGYYLFTHRDSLNGGSETEKTDTTETKQDEDLAEVSEPVDEGKTVIGTSVEGREIIANHYGMGDTELLFVGGIHGGYSWNTALVAYELTDYLEKNLAVVPGDVKVTVIPALNPDGLNTVVGTTSKFTKADVPSSLEDRIPGRFNANDVDLNRNFACDWQAEGKWQSKTVSGGTAEFSEPESKALRDYVLKNKPSAVVVWYSSAGGVFASSCHDGVLAETSDITTIFADASGYKAFQSFDFYSITGDMVNWLAKEKIPAISVLLTSHEETEWEQNRKGIEALIEHFSE